MLKSVQAYRGSMIFAIVLVLMTIAILVLAVKAGSIITGTGQRFTGVQGTMTRIQQSLVQYVANYQELPCPANPSLAATNSLAGEPNGTAPTIPPTPVTTCTYPAGIVPWKALGLTENDVTDPWGRLISYRVFDGVIGLTQAQGASEVNCDTSNIDLAGRQVAETSPTVSGLCFSDGNVADNNTLATSFTNHWSFSSIRTNSDKGLVVDDFGTVVRNVAYVLISHGPTGLGGWLPSGTRMSLPITTTADYPNTQTPSYYPSQTPTEFVKAAASDPSVADDTAGFYDDVVSYLKIDDLAHLAGLDPRDWPEALQTATDIQNFSVATTSNLINTAATDQFITTTVNASPSSTQEFQKTPSSGGVGGAGVTFGSGSGQYSAALWWPNQIQLYSPPPTGATVAVSGASWASGVVAFTTTASHNLEIGDTVTVTGALPSGYDGTYVVTGTPFSTAFTVAQEANPGTWNSGGTITKILGFRRTLVVSVEAAFNSSYAGGGLVLGFLPTDGYWVNASSSGAISLNPTLAISSVSASYQWWSNTTAITFYTSGQFPFVTGNTVTVSGMSNSNYNGTYTVSGATSNAFTVSQYGWPGSPPASGGSVTGTIAGSSSSSSGIGWDNGSDGNLPTPRFGVEMDMQYNSYRNDPYNENHIAVDGSGVTHGSTAASCSSSSNTYTSGCYTGSSNSWLMNGLTSFHRVRVEIEPMSPSCGSTAPLLKYWLLPYSVCSSLNTVATGTSWSNRVITFTTLTSHNFAVGDTVTVTGALPQGYNGTYTVTTVPSSTTFTVANSAGSTLVVGGTAWSSGVITFVTAANHGLSAGNTVTVTGASPSGYNGSYTVITTPTTNTFTVAQSSNPGPWAYGGIVAPTVAWVSGGTIAKTWNLTNGSWSGGVITFTTATPNFFVAGNAVTVSGASPSGYNGTFTVTSTTPTTFTVAIATDPGPWISGGTVTTAQDCTDIEDVSKLYNPQSFPSGGVYLSQCIATPSPTDAFNNMYFGFTSNNNNYSSSSGNFVLQNLNSSLISVP